MAVAVSGKQRVKTKIYLEKNRRKMNVLKVELLLKGIFVTHILKVAPDYIVVGGL